MKPNSTTVKGWAWGQFIPIVLAVFALSACAGAKPTNSGFLENYDELHAEKDGSNELVYYRQGPAVEYTEVSIDAVDWYIPAEMGKEFDKEERKELTLFFRDALEKALAKRFNLVDDARAGGVRVRAAITDINPSSPALNVLLTALLLGPLDSGGVGVELEAVDANSAERLVAYAAVENGSVFEFRADFSRFGHAKQLLEARAKWLASALERVGSTSIQKLGAVQTRHTTQ